MENSQTISTSDVMNNIHHLGHILMNVSRNNMSNIQKGMDIIKVDVDKNQETQMEIVDKIRIQQSTTTSSNAYDLSVVTTQSACGKFEGVK